MTAIVLFIAKSKTGVSDKDLAVHLEITVHEVKPLVSKMKAAGRIVFQDGAYLLSEDGKQLTANLVEDLTV